MGHTEEKTDKRPVFWHQCFLKMLKNNNIHISFWTVSPCLQDSQSGRVEHGHESDPQRHEDP